MSAGTIIKTVFELVEPSVHTCASRLFVLTTGRLGAKKHQPDIKSFYETGLVVSLFEHLLMSPRMRTYDVRWEMPLNKGSKGKNPPRVDLWLRPAGGAHPHFIEAGEFKKKKLETDHTKMARYNKAPGQNWFLAFFRSEVGDDVAWIQKKIQRSFKDPRGLDPTKWEAHDELMKVFKVLRTNGQHENFGFALLRAK